MKKSATNTKYRDRKQEQENRKKLAPLLLVNMKSFEKQ